MTKVEYAVPSKYLLTRCPTLAFEINTNGDLLNAFVEATSEYKICAARMGAVVEYFESLEAQP